MGYKKLILGVERSNIPANKSRNRKMFLPSVRFQVLTAASMKTGPIKLHGAISQKATFCLFVACLTTLPQQLRLCGVL
jgi:hypothetical protein